MCVSRQRVFCLSRPMRMSRGTLASMVAGQLVIYISGKYVLKHLSIMMQLQLKAPANVLPHWDQVISLILLSKWCICVHECKLVC